MSLRLYRFDLNPRRYNLEKTNMGSEEIKILGDDELLKIQEERDIEHQRKTLSLSAFPMLTQKSKFGLVYPKCVENIFTILTYHPDFSGRFKFDLWTDKMKIRKGDTWFDLEDADIVPIQRKIQRLYNPFVTVGKELVLDAVYDACRSKSYDSAEDYIRNLEWDNVPRIHSWISKVYGTENDEYHQAVGANFFKGMAKRITQPGCKFDTVIILEGKQGVGKSTSFSIIAGKDWHLETTLSTGNKDFFSQFRGKLIVEFSEGESLNRSETKQMKAVISTAVDTYRPAYGRIDKDFPRRCVFAMTTNQTGEYLKDETGNRRFYPVEVPGAINLKWLKENRNQLFAEALYRVEILEEPCHVYPESAKVIQASKMVRSQHEETIGKWLENPVGQGGCKINLDDGLIISDIWFYALVGDKSRFTKRDEMAIALALKGLGYEKSRRMIGGAQKNRWYKIGSTEPLL